ncbi:hypothetical protein BDY17DRAFT_301034 [Neohortaea acidophila]|uniref:Uncharacterized protein n=1 Tax=Neohortaea acidophila TaxID=245834 RepID=A0A6A6PMR1_9PEZI|nr:uncharacterized protein BDY17DRAFT_301034 [Neohortaea acidophila]KAF2481292.1 hypothetical protein BDY17DRAFT_301034 [Neohortaea acidophila]
MTNIRQEISPYNVLLVSSTPHLPQLLLPKSRSGRATMTQVPGMRGSVRVMRLRERAHGFKRQRRRGQKAANPADRSPFGGQARAACFIHVVCIATLEIIHPAGGSLLLFLGVQSVDALPSFPTAFLPWCESLKTAKDSRI